MKQLSISKHILMGLGFLVICGILAALIISTPKIGSALQTQTPIIEDSKSLQSAMDGTKAFFEVNYHDGKDIWLNRFCSFSSEVGCELVSMGADTLWKKYLDEKIVTLAEIVPVARIAETPDEQVWQLIVKLSTPLPGSNKTEDVAFVLVVRNGNEWRFDRFLTKPEIQVIAEKATKEVKQ